MPSIPNTNMNNNINVLFSTFIVPFLIALIEFLLNGSNPI